MIKKSTKLTDLDVTFISLVPKGANKREIIWKSDTELQDKIQFPITKVDEDQRLVYGVVYAPPRSEDDEDTQGDWMTPEDIKKASHQFMSKARTKNVDTDHSFEPAPASVVESWLTKVDGDLVDPLFPDEPEGSWVVGIYIEDDQLWDKIKKGDYNGLSLAGWGMREETPVETTKAKNFLDIVKADKVLKGIKDNFKMEMMSSLLWAFHDSAWSIFLDEEVEDKKGVMESQVADFMELLDGKVLKSDPSFLNATLTKAQEALKAFLGPDNPVQKEETVIMTDKVKKDQAPEIEPETKVDGDDPTVETPETTPTPEETPEHLTKADLQEAVTSAVQEAIQPLQERLDQLEKSPLIKMSLDDEVPMGETKKGGMFI